MKVYAELTIRGSKQALDRFLVTLESDLSHGWSRNHALEAEFQDHMTGTTYCFACTEEDSRPASELYLASRSDGSLYVSNVIAPAYRSLTAGQYNAILGEFCDRFVRPAASEVGVAVEASNTDPRLEDFVTPETAKLLIRFSRLANRSFLHHNDRQRWYEFLSAANREKATLTPDMLERWLMEEEGWSKERAYELAQEYQRALGLLNVFESQPA